MLAEIDRLPMGKDCCSSSGCVDTARSMPPRYRRALQLALVANAVMFAVEVVAGVRAGSISLLADAIDFAGDAANYGLSLAVLSMGTVWQSRAALIKGIAMGSYGVFILGQALWSLLTASVPDAATMGWIGALALCVNLSVAGLLFAYRAGNANMRSVWLCSRNDAIGNLAVLFAAASVGWLGAGWPDALVALLMGTLALTASRSVVQHARKELSGMGSASLT